MAKISAVWASRDDNFPPGVNRRLANSIGQFQWQAKKAGISIECIVVDWNPPQGGDLARKLQRRGISGVRIIQVPSGDAVSPNSPSQAVYLEYPAKNIGLFRASGDEVVVLSNDAIVSTELFSAILARPRLSNSFLRADRTDYNFPLLAAKKGLREPTLLHVRHGVSESDPITLPAAKWGRPGRGSQPLDGESSINGLIFSPPGGSAEHFLRGMHTNAAGDFISASRTNWIRAGGFDETNWVTNMGDSVMVARLTGLGLSQCILPGQGKLGHWNHSDVSRKSRQWEEADWPHLRDALLKISQGWASPPGQTFGQAEKVFEEINI